MAGYARSSGRRGYRYPRGEGHHKVNVPDSDVELVRELHEQHGIGYGELAKKFEVGKWTIRNWCTYRSRT